MDKNQRDIQKERENRVVHILLTNDEVHGFIGKGENTSKRGPGDKTGASYAFDLYDFANGTYHYEI